MELIWAYCPTCSRWFYSPTAQSPAESLDADGGVSAPSCPVCATVANELAAEARAVPEGVRG